MSGLILPFCTRLVPFDCQKDHFLVSAPVHRIFQGIPQQMQHAASPPRVPSYTP